MAAQVLRRVRVEGNIARLPLTNGYETIIDTADLHLVEGANWHAEVKLRRDGSIRTVYARRNMPALIEGRILTALHRIIMLPPSGMLVDHVNGDGLDNRRCNLRLATPAENNQNRRLSLSNTSGYKGVCFDKHKGKWRALIAANGRKVHLGHYTSAAEAAEAYETASICFHGAYGVAACRDEPETARQSALGVFG